MSSTEKLIDLFNSWITTINNNSSSDTAGGEKDDNKISVEDTVANLANQLNSFISNNLRQDDCDGKINEAAESIYDGVTTLATSDASWDKLKEQKSAISSYISNDANSLLADAKKKILESCVDDRKQVSNDADLEKYTIADLYQEIDSYELRAYQKYVSSYKPICQAELDEKVSKMKNCKYARLFIDVVIETIKSDEYNKYIDSSISNPISNSTSDSDCETYLDDYTAYINDADRILKFNSKYGDSLPHISKLQKCTIAETTSRMSTLNQCLSLWSNMSSNQQSKLKEAEVDNDIDDSELLELYKKPVSRSKLIKVIVIIVIIIIVVALIVIVIISARKFKQARAISTNTEI